MNPNDPNNPNNQFRGFGQYAPPFPNNPSNQQNRPFLNFPYGFPDPNSNPGFGFSQQTGSQFTESQFTGFAQLLANNPAPGLGFGFSQPETVPETQPETVPERDVGSSQRARKGKKKAVVLEDVEDEEPTVGRSRIPWSPFENECLVKAWMERSEDNVTGKFF